MLTINQEIKLYGYQEEATNFVLNNINETHVLLAAAPNAGKTFMASFIIKQLIKDGSRVLCSVHGTNILKRQFYDSICSIVGIENVSVYDTSDLSLYNPSKPIQVMIYQNTKQMEECVEEYGKFDYLVVDEAHKFYDDTTSMETIGDEYVYGNHLLLTGSPAIFKERVDSGEIRAKYISASLIESVQEGQYDKEIRLDVVSNDVHLTIDDYNQNGEVTEKSQRKLINNEPVLDSLLVDDFGKTIIFVKRTRQADIIETYLNKRGVINFVSHSESDKNSDNIDVFKDSYTGIDNVVLIVVGRATEGFDDPNVSIIDMTYSKNIDTLYQRYSRAIRNRTDTKDKRYVKVVPNNGNSAEVYVHIMTAVLMLLKQEHYENFNGKNFSIPTLKQEIKKPDCGVGTVKSYVPKPKHETTDITDTNIILKSKKNPQSVQDLVENDDFIVNVKVDNNTYEIKSEEYDTWVSKLNGKQYIITIQKSNDKVDDCLLMETKMYSGAFFDTKNELYGYITRYATSSLKDVLKEINGEIYASEEEHIQFIKDNNIKSGTGNYSVKYKTSELKLHSEPWNKYENGSIKDYFESIWGKKEEFATNEEHIQFIKDNEIISRNQYSLKYKTSQLKLYVTPWSKYGNGNSKDYFESIWGYFATEEEHINFIKTNNISNINTYSELYKTSELKLYSEPWNKYENGNSKDYFDSIWGYFATEEEHIQFIKDNNITRSVIYGRLYKTSELRLWGNPWKKFGNGSSKDYFESIWLDKEPTTREYKPAYLGEFSELNKKWNTSNSKTTHQRLKEDKSEWINYHKLYSQARKNWNEIPYQVIANILKDRPEWLIGDFGCGENLLKNEIPNKVLSFDHIAIDETVTECDLINIPLNDKVLDVVVFSLSLMGTNYKEYFKEAYRTLKPMGILLIAEPSTRWEERDEELKGMLIDEGFNISGDIRHTDKFIYVTAIKL